MELLPEKNAGYATQEYWDERYSKEDPSNTFDWFKTYADIRPLIQELIPSRDARILMLGCGNSSLSADMYDDGYTNIVNIDYSKVVIDMMRAKHAEARPGMEWLEMDIRSLSFPSSSFDIALDKGTMDALLASVNDVWNPAPEILVDCDREVAEVQRVLKAPHGKMIYLTFGQPHFRRKILNRDPAAWELEVRELGEGFSYYLYILRRKQEKKGQAEDGAQ